MSRPSTRAAIVATSPVTRLIRARVSSDTWCSGRSLSYSSPTMPPPNVSDAAISAIVAAVTCAAPFANYLPVIPGIGSDLGKNGKFAMGLGGWEVILPVALRRFSLGRAKPPRFSPSVHANTWVPTGSAPVPGLTVSATELRSHQRPCGGAGQGARPCPTAAECRARRVPARAAGRAYITVTKFMGSGDKARGIGVGARFDADSAVEGASKKFAGYRWFESISLQR